MFDNLNSQLQNSVELGMRLFKKGQIVSSLSESDHLTGIHISLGECCYKYIYSQTSIKRPLKGKVKSGLLKRWSLKKGLRV